MKTARCPLKEKGYLVDVANDGKLKSLAPGADGYYDGSHRPDFFWRDCRQ
jgi:hypothetical protein